MKVFLDRFSDLITLEKETGRKLRDKNMAVISNSNENDLDYDFYISFRKSAAHLGVNYLGDKHINVDTLKENQKLELNIINTKKQR